MQMMPRAGLQYSNQIVHNHNQPHMMQQQQQQSMLHQQQQQQLGFPQAVYQTQLQGFGAGMNMNPMRQDNNAFIRGQVPTAQPLMQTQQQSFGNVSNPVHLFNPQFQQANQQVLQNILQQQSFQPQLQQRFPQQLQQTFLQQFVQQQQPQSFPHQQQNLGQQQQAFNQQWQLNSSKQTTTADNLGFNQAQHGTSFLYSDGWLN